MLYCICRLRYHNSCDSPLSAINYSVLYIDDLKKERSTYAELVSRPLSPFRTIATAPHIGMHDPNDAFPDSDQLIRSTFDQPNAPTALVKLLNRYPIYHAVLDLVTTYTFIFEENPDRAKELATIMLAVRDAPDGLFADPSFRREFDVQMVDLQNHCLSLNADPTSSRAEVLVTAACIQLLIGGSELIKYSTSYFKSADEVSTKLKTQKASGAVKNLNALKLLELTILHAESGFKKENNNKDVWKLLFPSHI
ncbi:hypothetical protein BDN70DRAFT_899681 [Pholiota conissans]|uniref:Uncharacterized protein n=1 Tax=Pholiota conissans TaxID=109636 RepID=A0A9P5YPH9_9AGAR|nr:hypothetical protein BDN70DRAFT_899681 [Pholiota conissans]